MVDNILFELAIIIGIAAILALIGRLIKQPTIIAYLITGVLIGPLFFDVLQSKELIEIFAHLGVTFLLFILGLSLDFSILKKVGPVVFVVGIVQIIITSTFGFLIALWLGMSYVPAIFLAVALGFSSTVFVMKLLSDNAETDTLHGRITLGILIVQDFIGVLVLLGISVIGVPESFAAIQVIEGIVLIALVFILSHLLIPRILSIAAKSQEVLFLFSIGWALALAMLFSFMGFSVEMGALIAGMSLASSRFSLEISSKINGLREFFVIIHLIFFGSLLSGPITTELFTGALIFSGLILIGNPVIVMAIMKLFGYKKRTSFLTGISIAQISEFSLIVVFLSFTLGVLQQEVLSLVILIALITIGLSSYGIHYSKPLYKLFSPMLGVFDGKGRKEPGTAQLNKKYEVILFGYNRTGFSLLKLFLKKKKDYLVIDYNPEIIKKLSAKNINCVYGDANDPEFLRTLHLEKAETIISTIPDFETNLSILRKIRKRRTAFIPTSRYFEEAEILYSEGATYVIMPHFLGGGYMAHMLERHKFDKSLLSKEGKKHILELRERVSEEKNRHRRRKHKRR